MARRDQLFANRLKEAGIDLSKDFFDFNNADYEKIDQVRKSLRYAGKNSLGREPYRQFYYAAQRGEQKNRRDEALANGATRSAANKAAGISNG